MMAYADSMSGLPSMQDIDGQSSRFDVAAISTQALKLMLAQHGCTYTDLAERLTAMGFPETEASVSQKIRRGTFQFGFFVQCIVALGLNEVTVIAPSDSHSKMVIRTLTSR